MTGDQFRSWRTQQDLTQGQVAALFGVHEDTVANWERERTKIPKTVELTTALLAKKKYRKKVFSTT